MKITQVTPQKKNPRRFNIFLDGQFGFGADEDLVVHWRLLPGKELSPTDLEKLLYEAEVGKLMERMYRLFGIRMRSETEVRQYFRVKNLESRVKDKEPISESVIDQLIEKLKQKGMIDDEVFAKAWVEARRRSKKLGPRALRAELIKKGIEKEIIKNVIASEAKQSEKGIASSPALRNDVPTNEQLAREALEKRLERWKNLKPLEFRKKATDYLLRKGFDYSTIKSVLQKVIS